MEKYYRRNYSKSVKSSTQRSFVAGFLSNCDSQSWVSTPPTPELRFCSTTVKFYRIDHMTWWLFYFLWKKMKETTLTPSLKLDLFTSSHYVFYFEEIRGIGAFIKAWFINTVWEYTVNHTSSLNHFLEIDILSNCVLKTTSIRFQRKL